MGRSWTGLRKERFVICQVSFFLLLKQTIYNCPSINTTLTKVQVEKRVDDYESFLLAVITVFRGI